MARGSCSSGEQPRTLPIDLIGEILARLPVKPLLRFRCVCKLWNILISDPHFVKKQLRASASDPNRRHLMMAFLNQPDDSVLIDYSLPSLFNSSRALTSTLRACPVILKNRFHHLVGSCHGMLCIATRRGGVFLWNPSTAKVKTLPPFEASDYTKFGFGYDHLNDCYKVVAVVFHARLVGGTLVFEIDVMVHNLGSDSWRVIQGFPVMKSPLSHSGIFASGTLNWSGNDETRWVIVSLDVGMETFRRISPPDCVAETLAFALTIGVLKGCLCILVDCNIASDVWVMKDFGNKESWTKLFSVSFNLGGFPSEYLFYMIRPLCISDEDDVILLQFGSKAILYISKNGTFGTVGMENVAGPCIAEVYAESLVSPCC